MSDLEPWEQLVIAETAYTEAHVEVVKAGVESQLALALASPIGRGTALRVLRDSPVELVMSLIDLVFESASSTHSQVGLAREVMARVDPGWLSTVLDPLVTRMLANSDLDWSDYRRLAEMLSELAQSSLLARVVTQASESADEDVREVADDFRGH